MLTRTVNVELTANLTEGYGRGGGLSSAQCYSGIPGASVTISDGGITGVIGLSTEFSDQSYTDGSGYLYYVESATCELTVVASLEYRPSIYYADPLPDTAGSMAVPNNIRQAVGAYDGFWVDTASVILAATAHWRRIDPATNEPDGWSDDRTYGASDTVSVDETELTGSGIALPSWGSGATSSAIGTDTYRTFANGTVEVTVNNGTSDEDQGYDFTAWGPSGEVVNPRLVYTPHGWTAYLYADDGDADGGGDVSLASSLGINATGGSGHHVETTLTAVTQTDVLPVSRSSVRPNFSTVYGSTGQNESGAYAWWADSAFTRMDEGRGSAGWAGLLEVLPMRFNENASWTPFNLGRVASIQVDDFSDTPPAGYDWSAGTFGAGERVITGTTSVYRDLRDDWFWIMDYATGPAGWKNANIGAGGDTQRAAEYIDLLSMPYKVKRRLRSDSDYANWSNHRWLKIRGRCDGGGTLTLRIHYRDLEIQDDFAQLPLLATDDVLYVDEPGNHREISYTEASPVPTADVTGLTLGNTTTDLYVDLAELANRCDGLLSHIKRIELCDLDSGKTYRMAGIWLCSGEATGVHAVDEGSAVWGYATGVGYADDACLFPYADGRACLRSEPGTHGYPWGVSAIERLAGSDSGSPRPADRSLRFHALVEDIWAQGEGFTVAADERLPFATMGWTDPGEDASDEYAIWLDPGWHDGGTDATATLRLAQVDVDAGLTLTLDAHHEFYADVRGLAFDAPNQWAAPGQTVRLMEQGDDDPPTTGDGTADSETALGDLTTDANGAFAQADLPQASVGEVEDDLDLTTARDIWPTVTTYRVDGVTVTDVSTGDPVEGVAFRAWNRGYVYPVVAGQVPADENAEQVYVLEDETRWTYRAYVEGGLIQVDRRTQPDGTFSVIGTHAGYRPSVWKDRDGRVWCWYDDDAGDVRKWDVEGGTTVSVASGKWPVGTGKADGSLYVVTYWRGNNTYAKVYDAQGTVMHGGEVTVKATLAEQPVYVRWLPSGAMQAYYSDGTDVQVLTSNDNGATWA